MNVEKNYQLRKKVPYIRAELYLSHDGKITDRDSNELTLDDFCRISGAVVNSIGSLLLVTYGHLNWPPVYWKYVDYHAEVEPVRPENISLILTDPVESLEYPGFYMIPGYSGYVISERGCLINKLTGSEMTATVNGDGYFTFRMRGDDGRVGNRLRHRILCLAFKGHPYNVDNLDVNHINGIPGSDSLDNLEWCTRSQNMFHAVNNGLRNDNRDVQVRDVHSGNVLIFGSYSQAGNFFKVTETTISNRAKTQGYKVYDGFQFRDHPNDTPWPEIEVNVGSYLIKDKAGNTLKVTSKEAARLFGLTRTSFMRAVRENRLSSKDGNFILLGKTSKSACGENHK